ncbi:MAG: Fe-S cluster assembly protein SufB [Puniceicoccales bacterium]|jgi:Fe-S cluster assembly protein SufB|nr:Fe-S cluster assembly protein SufB [Puniceicoccales bacterium]
MIFSERAKEREAMDNFQQSMDEANFRCDVDYKYDAGVGLSHQTIDYISDAKNDADWIRKFRHAALEKFYETQLPKWVTNADVHSLDFSRIRYYLANDRAPKTSWENVSPDIKETFERLGIPEKERKFLAGVEAQFDSEFAYSRMREELGKQGVIFVDSAEGLNKFPEIFRRFFGTVVPVSDNKFSALNGAVFSGGSFVYIPRGVRVKQPLQAYFRINAENFGQFERTLIVVDEEAEVTYMEGCTAPKFETSTLHSAVVEVVALKNSKVQYVTVQNWSSNVFNLVTKRAVAHECAEIKWIDCNIGSRVTVKYPAIYLKGKGAKGEILSIAVASDGQIQDTGAKAIHLADGTTSNIVSKSVSFQTGMASYRGIVSIPNHLKGCKNNTRCDALLVNPTSRTATFPKISVAGNENIVQHEASVSRVSEEQIFYMQQRGIPEAQAMSLSVNGFINDLVREFPMEYSVEMKRLIEMQTEKAVA